jgi:spore coat polysaccharide biosynthesis protein SpsF (cytidylyltransferase family)
MGSSRFPGKVLEDLNGKPILQYIVDFLNKLKNTTHIDNFVIATPNTNENQPLWDFLDSMNIKYFKGSNSDVLDRFYQCAKENNSDTIVRICADVPYLTDWKVIQQIENFKKDGLFSYGNGAWVFSFDALEESWKHGHHPEDREHVTTRMFDAIDYPDDLERIRNKQI